MTSKKPISPTKEMLEILESWAAPDVTETKQKELKGKTNFLGMPLEDLFNKAKSDQLDVEEEDVKPLTAEEIEQIRAEAYQDGFEQGKQEGIEAGHQEGLQKGHEEGSQQGYKEGYEAGYGQGKEAVDDEVAHWKTLSQQLYSPISKVDAAAEQQLVNLAVMLAEKIVRVETQNNETALMHVLHEAISSLPFNTEFAEIHMHPDDIVFVTQAYDQDTITENKWILKDEPAYQRGDVIVMTPNSLIDRSVKQRIKQVLDSFADKTDLNKELNSSENNSESKYQNRIQEQHVETVETNEHVDSNNKPDNELVTATQEGPAEQDELEGQTDEMSNPSGEIEEPKDTNQGEG